MEAKTDSKCYNFNQAVDKGKDLKYQLKAEKGKIAEEEEDDDDNKAISNPWQINQSAALSVRQSGLNLALSLGVISHKEF